MNIYISLSQAVYRVADRAGQWPNIGPALHSILSAVAKGKTQLFGVQGEHAGGLHVAVPVAALVREPRLGALRSVQFAGVGLAASGSTVEPGQELVDGTDGWLRDGSDDRLTDAHGNVTWACLAMLAPDVDRLWPVSASVEEHKEEEAADAPRRRKKNSSKLDRVAAWLKDNYDSRPSDVKTILAHLQQSAGVKCHRTTFFAALNKAFPSGVQNSSN